MSEPIPSPQPPKDDDLDLNEALRQLDAKLEPPNRANKPLMALSHSQKAAVGHLENLYKLRLLRSFPGGFKVRTHALCAGASGTGKSTVVQLFAQRLGLPCLSLCAGQWTVWNARSERFTLDVIGQFVRSNPCGVILIDEIDKLTNHHSHEHYWASAVAAELFALLDGDDRLESANFTADDRARLGRYHQIVGCGAWQHHWHSALQGEGMAERIYRKKVMEDSGLPDEILFRFSDPQIIMPPDERELADFISKIHRDLGLPLLREAELKELTQQAVQSGRALRDLENYATQLLVTATTDVTFEKLLASVPPAIVVGKSLFGETKGEATKRLFGELRTCGAELDQLAHQIIQSLPPLSSDAWLPIYRTLALDSLSTGIIDHFKFTKRELDELPSSTRLEERVADMSLQRPALLGELRHVFVKVSEAAVSYTAVGKNADRKANETMLIIFGAWVAERLTDLLHGVDGIAIPYDLTLLLATFIRAQTKWERAYNQLLALLDVA